MARFEKFYAPFTEEIREMGYEPLKTSPEAQQWLVDVLIADTSVFKVQARWYMSRYGNMNALCRKSIAVYAHGLDNFGQYGKSFEAIVYQMWSRAVRDLMDKYNNFSGVDRERARVPWFKRRHIVAFTEGYVDRVLAEARDQVRRKNGEQVVYRGYKQVRGRNKTGRNATGMYRIERLADMYD